MSFVPRRVTSRAERVARCSAEKRRGTRSLAVAPRDLSDLALRGSHLLPYARVMITLYSGPLSMFGAKAEIALREKGLDFELVMVPFDNARGYDPKHPEVLRINPKRQVPVLVDGALELFDSTQIFEYLEDLAPETALWPRDVGARARARRLEHESDEVYFPHVIKLMGLQATPDDPAAIAARAGAAAFYARIEALLEDRGFLAGEFTYADIAFYMASLFGARMGAAPDSSTPRVLAWRERVGARPAVRSVVGAMAAYLRANGRAVPDFVDQSRAIAAA
jgi:glutathione S-transferase